METQPELQQQVQEQNCVELEITNEQLPLLVDLINMIALNENCQPFLEPVNWEDLEIKDYPDVIKNPMDIGTLKVNLSNGVYRTYEKVF